MGEPIHDFETIAAVDRSNEFDGTPAFQIRDPGKEKNWTARANAQQPCILGIDKSSFDRLIGGVHMDPVLIGQSLVERSVRIEGFQQIAQIVRKGDSWSRCP